MNESEALLEAGNFSKTAYAAELDKLTHEYNDKLRELRNKLAAQGSVLSGNEVVGSARIVGEKLNRLLQVKLDAFLEGCELHSVQVTPVIVQNTIQEILELKETLLKNAAQAYATNSPNKRIGISVYEPTLRKEIHCSAASIKTTIDRWRLKMKAEPKVTNIYHVIGHNARWVTNGSDHSVNVVTISNEQVFTNLRQEIESKISDGEERKDILEKLAKLEEAQNSPTLLQRYTEFISVAANHMAIIAPFVPALTEILHKSL